MFIATLVTIAKIWKQLDAPLLMNRLRKCDIGDRAREGNQLRCTGCKES
jgi:hypothetical protein